MLKLKSVSSYLDQLEPWKWVQNDQIFEKFQRFWWDLGDLKIFDEQNSQVQFRNSQVQFRNSQVIWMKSSASFN